VDSGDLKAPIALRLVLALCGDQDSIDSCQNGMFVGQTGELIDSVALYLN